MASPIVAELTEDELSHEEDEALWDTNNAGFFDLNTLATTLHKALPEPLVPIAPKENEAVPVVKIDYTREFNLVTSILRGLDASAEASPRAFAALAFGLRFCPANYAVWKRRRDVLLSPTRFEKACTFGLGLSPRSWRPARPLAPTKAELDDLSMSERRARWAKHARLEARNRYTFPPYLDGKLYVEQSSSSEPRYRQLNPTEALLTLWTPIGEHVLPLVRSSDATTRNCPIGSVVVTSNAGCNRWDAAAENGRGFPDDVPRGGGDCCHDRLYDPWMALAWELRTTRVIVVSTGKSFQTWNHRKELFLEVASMTAAAVVDRLQSTRKGEDEEGAVAMGDLTFRLFDERILTSYVLRHVDSKNYHAWSHRAWFVAFAGLLGIPSELENEIAFTSDMIEADPFNNSAWAHRMLVLQYWCSNRSDTIVEADVMAMLTAKDPSLQNAFVAFPDYFPCRWARNPRVRQPLKAGGSNQSTAMAEESWTRIEAEAAAALRFVRKEPRNESPFTYILGLADLLPLIDAPVAVQRMMSLLAAVEECVDGVLADAVADAMGESAAPKNSRGVGYLPGSTEALRRTHVQTHALSCVHALCGSIMRVAQHASEPVEAVWITRMQQKGRSAALQLRSIDPIRAKYWSFEAGEWRP